MSLPTSSARVLDIGRGWGGMLRSIVKNHNQVEVFGLSISSERLIGSIRRECVDHFIVVGEAPNLAILCSLLQRH
jgi:ubiquinone/menaquinone biosynthesis C-methylase UbiE